MNGRRDVGPRRVEFSPTWESWRETARSALRAGILPEQLVWEPEQPTSPVLRLDLFAVVPPPSKSDPEPSDPATNDPATFHPANNDPSASDPLAKDQPASDPPALDADLSREHGPGPPPNQQVSGADRARVPRRFVELSQAASCHSDPGRWTLFYRLLWRLTRGEPYLLDVGIDRDVRRLMEMEKDVRRASHKMKAFVRFRATGGADDPFVAWFEPQHPVVERVAPFFARRFAGMKWSILTPDRCAHWDLQELRFTPGVPRSAAPSADALEDLWRTYYANIFNPARLNTRAMQAELPKSYWKNLPEAELIDTLRRGAPTRTRKMVEQTSSPATEPALRARKPGRDTS